MGMGLRESLVDNEPGSEVHGIMSGDVRPAENVIAQTLGAISEAAGCESDATCQLVAEDLLHSWF